MNLAGRVARLEKSPALRPTVAPCPECGDHPGAQAGYRVEFADDQHRRPAWCGTCGRQTVFFIEFDRAG